MTVPAGRDPKTQIPLSAATFYIMLAVASGERHGYAVIKEVEASTNGDVKLLPGTLYRLIKQLVADGWIVEEERNDPDDDQRRRYYRLTSWGRAIATAEAQRLVQVVRFAQSRDLLPVPQF